MGYRKVEDFMSLCWLDFPQPLQIYIVRTNRKSVEVSLAPYLMSICLRVPRDLPVETVREIVFNHADRFRDDVITWLVHKQRHLLKSDE
jgi:hypothetical protein